MKIQYLGFLPAILLILVSHYFAIRDYHQMEEQIFPPVIIALVICALFWIVVIMVGIAWALS